MRAAGVLLATAYKALLYIRFRYACPVKALALFSLFQLHMQVYRRYH
jgi:hypothetical protein